MRRRKKYAKRAKKEKETAAKSTKPELDYIPLGKCKACVRTLKDTDFKGNDEAYAKFASTGLCPRCQTQTDEVDADLLEPPLEGILEEEKGILEEENE
jgi:hypothetical protein